MVAMITTLVYMLVMKEDNRNTDKEDIDWDQLSGPISTLETIRARGYLNCGITKRDDTVNYAESYFEEMNKFYSNICAAFAAALFGGQSNVTEVKLSEEDRWSALEDGKIDVLLVGTPSPTGGLHWNVSFPFNTHNLQPSCYPLATLLITL